MSGVCRRHDGMRRQHQGVRLHARASAYGSRRGAGNSGRGSDSGAADATGRRRDQVASRYNSCLSGASSARFSTAMLVHRWRSGIGSYRYGCCHRRYTALSSRSRTRSSASSLQQVGLAPQFLTVLPERHRPVRGEEPAQLEVPDVFVHEIFTGPTGLFRGYPFAHTFRCANPTPTGSPGQPVVADPFRGLAPSRKGADVHVLDRIDADTVAVPPDDVAAGGSLRGRWCGAEWRCVAEAAGRTAFRGIRRSGSPKGYLDDPPYLPLPAPFVPAGFEERTPGPHVRDLAVPEPTTLSRYLPLPTHGSGLQRPTGRTADNRQ